VAKRDAKKPESQKASKRPKGEPDTAAIARHDRRLEKAKLRRDLAIMDVKANTPDFKKLRGKKRAAAVERANRAERQQECIGRKAATRTRLAALKPAERREASEKGSRQFGNKAKPWHLLGISRTAWEEMKKHEQQAAQKS
jgi:hypothetical protein